MARHGVYQYATAGPRADRAAAGWCQVHYDGARGGGGVGCARGLAGEEEQEQQQTRQQLRATEINSLSRVMGWVAGLGTLTRLLLRDLGWQSRRIIQRKEDVDIMCQSCSRPFLLEETG